MTKEDLEQSVSAILGGSSENILREARKPESFARRKAAVDAIEAFARKATAAPIPPLPWSLHRLYEDIGDRKNFEKPYFERRQALAGIEIAILAGRDTDGG